MSSWAWLLDVSETEVKESLLLEPRHFLVFMQHSLWTEAELDINVKIILSGFPVQLLKARLLVPQRLLCLYGNILCYFHSHCNLQTVFQVIKTIYKLTGSSDLV